MTRFQIIAIRIAAAALVLLGAFWLALPWLIPKFVDTSDLIVKIETGLNDALGIRFEIDSLRVKPTLFDGLHVQLSSNRIYDLKGQDIGNVELADIKVRYIPLIRSQKVEIKRITLKKPFLPVGEVSLFNQIALKLEENKPKVAELKDATVIATDYVIHDYRVADHNNLILEEAKSFIIQGKRLELKHLLDNKPEQPLELKMNGRMYFDPLKRTDVSARYELTLAFPEEAIQTKPTPETRAINPDGKFDWQDITDLRLKLSEKDLGLDLRMRKGKGRLTSKATSLMKTEALYHQISDTFEVPVPELAFETYLAGQLSGDVDFDLSDLARKRPPSLNGRIHFDQVTVSDRKDFRNPVINRISGNLNFKDKALILDNLAVLLDRHRFLLNGWYRMDSQKMDLRVRGRELQLATLKQTLQRLGGMLDLPLPDLSQYQVSGLANADLRIYGTPKDIGYSGKLQLSQGRYHDKQTGLTLSNLVGDILINQSILVRRLTGNVGSTPFQVTGRLSRALDAYSLKLVSNRVDLEAFYREVLTKLPQLQGQLAQFGTPQGLANANLLLTKRPEQSQPDYRGTVRLSQGQYTDPKTKLTVHNIAGLVDIENQIRLENFQAFLGSTRFTLAGAIDKAFKDYRFNLQGDRIDVRTFVNEVLTQLPEFRDDVAQLKDASGTGKLNLVITDESGINGTLALNQLAVRPAGLDSTVRIPQAVIRLNGNEIVISQTRGTFGPVGFVAQGQASLTGGTYRFTVNTGETPVSMLREEPEFISNLVGAKVPALWNTAGSFALNGELTPRGMTGALVLNDAGASWQGGTFPLYNANGRVEFTKVGANPPGFSTNNLTFKYGNSPIRLTANYDGQMHLQSEGVLSPLLVNQTIMSPRATTTPYREVPFELTVDGDVNALLPPMQGKPGSGGEVSATLLADLSRSLMPRETAEETAQTSPRLATAEAATSSGRSQVKGSLKETEASATPPAETTPNAAVSNPSVPEMPPILQPGEIEIPETDANLSARIRMRRNRLDVDEVVLNLGDSGLLQGTGYVNNPLAPSDYAFHLLTSPELDFTQLNTVFDRPVFEEAQGTVAADLTISGSPEAGNRVDGWLSIDELQLPQLQIRNLTADAEFNGLAANLDVANFQVPGVNVSLQALAQDISRTPVELDTVSITGDRFVVSAFNDFNLNVVNDIIVKQFLNQILPPRQEGDPVLPIEFREADVALDEVIYQNIILDDVIGNLSLYSNGYMEMSDVELKAAEGTVRGYLSMSPSDNHYVSLDITTEDVAANALTKALLNVTNQIFGNIDGTIRFTTQGETDAELLQNANGTVDFVITDGRLPAVAKVETLLTAANIVRGGVLGFNLNNLFRTVASYNTNYFAEMSGNLQIAEGTLYTDDLVSDGQNLDLFIQGEISMEDGSADLLVNGVMSQDVSGALGPLGRLSLGTVVRWIPGLGFLPGEETQRAGLIQRIPLLGYIPGLGGAPGEYNRFQVRIEGSLDDPNAIKDFQWVRSSAL